MCGPVNEGASICLLLRLLGGALQDPNCVNVADWFQAFMDVHQQQQQQRQQGPKGGSRGKKAALKRKGKGSIEVRGWARQHQFYTPFVPVS